MKLPIGLFIGISLWSCAWSAFLRILKQEAVDNKVFVKKKKKNGDVFYSYHFHYEKNNMSIPRPTKKIAVIVWH